MSVSYSGDLRRRVVDAYESKEGSMRQLEYSNKRRDKKRQEY